MALAIKEFATRDALMQAAAHRVADALQQAILKYGSACAALSGGTTPSAAYRLLAAIPLDWPRITFALVDERFVPPNSEGSNEAMAREALRSALSAGARFLPMYSPARDADEAARVADAAYRQLRIDMAVMGMGEDGHTASWFANADKLNEALDLTNPRTVIALRATGAPGSADRLTVTRAALARAGAIILLITGAKKRVRLESSFAGEWAPVSALFAPEMPSPEVFWAA